MNIIHNVVYGWKSSRQTYRAKNISISKHHDYLKLYKLQVKLHLYITVVFMCFPEMFMLLFRIKVVIYFFFKKKKNVKRSKIANIKSIKKNFFALIAETVQQKLYANYTNLPKTLVGPVLNVLLAIFINLILFVF